MTTFKLHDMLQVVDLVQMYQTYNKYMDYISAFTLLSIFIRITRSIYVFPVSVLAVSCLHYVSGLIECISVSKHE